MNTLIIYPYKMSSKSAKDLAQSLTCIRVYPDRNYRYKSHHLVINWGNSRYPNWHYNSSNFLNESIHVANATNKTKTFNLFKEQEVSSPDFTNNKTIANTWIEQGHQVFCRQLLTGHSGRGIVIASTTEELVDAPLYTKAIKKDKEYRVHVFQGKIIDFQQKKKRNGFEGGIDGIRNHSNGWIYARSDVELPETVGNEAIKAVQALGLDFGAVDICTSLEGSVYVFEVNTAPGLTGTTLQKYKDTFLNYLRDYHD